MWRSDILECYNIVSWLYGCDTFSNGLHNASALMTKNDWERALGILARECVCICRYNQVVKGVLYVFKGVPVWQTPV